MSNIINVVKHRGQDLYVAFDKYRIKNRTAILLTTDTGEPYATATMNLPEVELAEDEVIIKDYSENEGIYDSLVQAGIIGETIRTVQAGFVEAPIVKLLVDPETGEKL